ncbi:Histone-lysine N-methyltransferase SETMAR [Aphelenchoides bicaudatus]|nr:Histone-lysine N-methyltransferase SETMAR [Aphelenchoides bicaudatus]
MATAEPRTAHIRHCLLFMFDQRMTSTDAWRKINDTYGNRTISKSQVVRWFAKFESGDRQLYRLKTTNESMNIPKPKQPTYRKPAAKQNEVITIKEETDDDITEIKQETGVILVKQEDDMDIIVC